MCKLKTVRMAQGPSTRTNNKNLEISKAVLDSLQFLQQNTSWSTKCISKILGKEGSFKHVDKKILGKRVGATLINGVKLGLLKRRGNRFHLRKAITKNKNCGSRHTRQRKRIASHNSRRTRPSSHVRKHRRSTTHKRGRSTTHKRSRSANYKRKRTRFSSHKRKRIRANLQKRQRSRSATHKRGQSAKLGNSRVRDSLSLIEND